MDIQTASRQDQQHTQQPAGGRGGAGSQRRGGERSEPPRSGETAPPRAPTNPNRQDTTTAMTSTIAPCPLAKLDRACEDRSGPEMVPCPTPSQNRSPQNPKRPDPEVVQCPKRRKFSAEYKRRILEELDACTKPGQIGALMRREGLYSSTLTQWRRQRDQKGVEGLAPKKRGPKSTRDPQAETIQRLERENARLRKGLEQSRLIIDIQKKTAALLAMEIDETHTPSSSENGDDRP